MTLPLFTPFLSTFECWFGISSVRCVSLIRLDDRKVGGHHHHHHHFSSLFSSYSDAQASLDDEQEERESERYRMYINRIEE